MSIMVIEVGREYNRYLVHNLAPGSGTFWLDEVDFPMTSDFTTIALKRIKVIQ
jgi:hypothetical protein